jgi:hypothetical protein
MCQATTGDVDDGIHSEFVKGGMKWTEAWNTVNDLRRGATTEEEKDKTL